jgi:hypothetical protein
MVWTETEPGVWTDEYDGAERVFYGMSQAFKGLGKEHGSVYTVCRIRLQHPSMSLSSNSDTHTASFAKHLRDAWKALRFECPALSVFADGSQKKYLAATPNRVERWAEETFSINNTARAASSVVPTLHLRKLPYLVFLSSSSEVIFHCSHWRIDALGTCMVLNRLFDLLSQAITRGVTGPVAQAVPPLPLPWDLEFHNLSQSLEDAFGAPTACTPAMKILAETIRKRNFETSYPSAGLPYQGDATTAPAVSRSQATEFTVESTKDMIAACKARGISVTAAVHAACAEAVFDLQKEPHVCSSYSTIVSANLRDYLPSPPSTQTQHGDNDPGPRESLPYMCGTYVTGITHTLRQEDDFAARSIQLTQGYRGDWDVQEYMTALRPIYRVHGESLAAIARSGTRAPASNVTVSSLGVVDKYLSSDHGAVQIDGFRLGSAIMSRQPTLYIWTFGGRLTLSVDYNEAYYSVGLITGMLERIRRCLEMELALTLNVGEEMTN